MRTRARTIVATFAVVIAGVAGASAGIAGAAGSADVSATASTVGVTSVARSGTVTVYGIVKNNGPDAVKLTTSYHVSDGTVVGMNASGGQGTCTMTTPTTVHCITSVAVASGTTIWTDIVVKPTTDITKHHVEITVTGGPQATDPNLTNNKSMVTLKIIG